MAKLIGAKHAEKTLKAHAKTTGREGLDLRSQMIELIADLMLLAHEEGIPIRELLGQVYGMYERYFEPEEQ